MSITHIAQGIVSFGLPGNIRYFDTSNAQIEFSQDPEGTAFYLRPNVWFRCTQENVKLVNQVSIRTLNPRYATRIKKISIQAKTGAPEIDGTTFVYVEYEYYDTGSSMWVDAFGSIVGDMTIEFSFIQ